MLNNSKYTVFHFKKSLQKCEMISWAFIVCIVIEIGTVMALFTTLESFQYKLLYISFHGFLGISMISITICSLIILRSVQKKLSTINTETHSFKSESNIIESKIIESKKPKNTEVTQTQKRIKVTRPSMHEYDFIKRESLSNHYEFYSEVNDSLIAPNETENPIVENEKSPRLQNTNSPSSLKQNFGNTIKEMASSDFKLNSGLNTTITSDVIPLSHTLNRGSSVTPKLERFVKKSDFASNMDDLDRFITDIQTDTRASNTEISNWKDDHDYDYIKN